MALSERQQVGLAQLHAKMYDHLDPQAVPNRQIALAKLILEDIHAIQRANGLPLTEVEQEDFFGLRGHYDHLSVQAEEE